MKKLTSAIFICVLLLSTSLSIAQKVGIKTNLLYGIGTKTPNLGLEATLKEKNTIEIRGGYNPWNLKGHKNGNKKMVHWLIQPEWKYWFCSAFKGHYIGIQGIGSHYNINKTHIPLLFDKKYRYQGYMLGGGVTYGYQWVLGKRWNLEASLGIGAAYLNYDKYDCPNCGFQIEKDKTKIYYGPTKANISIIYLIK